MSECTMLSAEDKTMDEMQWSH